MIFIIYISNLNYDDYYHPKIQYKAYFVFFLYTYEGPGRKSVK